MTPPNLQGKKLLPHTAAAATTIATMATTRVPCLEEPEPSQMQRSKLFVICLGKQQQRTSKYKSQHRSHPRGSVEI